MKRKTVKIKLLSRIAFLCSFCFMLTACLTLFAACGGDDEEDASELKSASEIYAAVLTLATFPEMARMGETDLGDVIGVDTQRLKGYEMYVSADGGQVDEIAIFELEDEDYREELVRILDARLRNKANIARSYNTEQYDIVTRSAVEEKGNFIFYVVHEDSELFLPTVKAMIAE